MKVIIQEPAPFFSKKDEDSFFQWLSSIEAVVNYAGVPQGLEITLADPVDDISLRELIGLLTRYSLKMEWLKQFRTETNQSWFDDEIMFWHRSVFG